MSYTLFSLMFLFKNFFLKGTKYILDEKYYIHSIFIVISQQTLGGRYWFFGIGNNWILSFLYDNKRIYQIK